MCRLFLICFSFAFVANSANAFDVVPLKVEEKFTLPVREISGLGWRLDPDTKKRELLVAGDHSHDLYLVDWDRRQEKMPFYKIDVSTLEKGLLSLKTQWEAVTADKTGRIFLVKEDPILIQVLSPDLKKLEMEIHLKIPEGQNAGLTWNDVKNEGPEGLLLANNGHVLIVKEKNPVAILEFGPQGEKAKGFTQSMDAMKGNGFPLPKVVDGSADLYLLKKWNLDPQLELLMEDCSEIHLGPRGDLFILSADRGFLVLLGRTLRTSQSTLTAKKIWSLPAEVEQPEGLVIDDDGRPVVAIDKKKTHKANLFVLSPLGRSHP